MVNYYKYKRDLNRMTFDNFLRDDSNEMVYKRLYSLAQSNSFANNCILLYGPGKSGKAHLIISLLDSILEKKSNLKIEKTNGYDFLSHIIWEARKREYGNVNGYIDTLLSNDILVIEDINYIDKQLSEVYLIKKAFCDLLDRWDYKNKLIILTVNESHDGQITDEDVLYRLSKFESLFIHKQTDNLKKRWISHAIKLSKSPIEAGIVDMFVNESNSITHCRNLLLNHYLKEKPNTLSIVKPTPSLEQILDFALGEQDGYKRVMDYEKILKSDFRRRSTVYYLQKYTNMSYEEIASALHIDVEMAKTALEEYLTDKEESEQTRAAFEYMEEFLLDWEPNYYHMEGIKSANDD